MYARVLQIDVVCKRTMALFALVIALSAFLYGAFLLIAVERTAARAKAQSEIRALSNDLGTLEGQYLSAEQGLTLTRAQELGFVEPAQSTIVYTDSVRALTFAHGGQ